MAVEQFTTGEITELDRIHRRFQNTGDIRLGLMQREAVKWSNRWNFLTKISAAVSVAGEGFRLAGKLTGSDTLQAIGKYSRNFGLVAVPISWVAAGLSEFYAQDARIEQVFREDMRRR